MESQHYTESQVLHGLFIVWRDVTGDDDLFDANTRIDTHMKANGSWEEIDFADIRFHIERFFGFTSTDKEWIDFFGFEIARRNSSEWEETFAPMLTFGSLARFIADRAPVIATFEPIRILGRECAPAGVFIGIQHVANTVTRRQLQFGPSSRIIDVLRGRDLDEFWTKVCWLSEHSLPQLPTLWCYARGMGGCLGVLALFAGVAFAWQASNPLWFCLALLGGIMLYALTWTYQRFTNPLPTDLVTFRDLSMLIANRSVKRYSSIRRTNG